MNKIKHFCNDINWSLKRLLVYVGGAACTAGFLKDAWENGAMEYRTYLAYAGALTILYTPQWAMHVIEIYKGVKK